MNISVLIPTYQRPDLIIECLKSCVAQSYSPSEIVIGDDSHDDLTHQAVMSFAKNVAIPIYYHKNQPHLGQGENNHSLIHRACGEFICLIHDDDYLHKNALEILHETMQKYASEVAFGKQFYLNHNDDVDEELSDKLSKVFRRCAPYEGLQKDFLQSAILQQFPNNGFLIRASIAKAVGYREATETFKDACDFGFGVLCARKFPQTKIAFSDHYVSYYRTSNTSIARNNKGYNGPFYCFNYVFTLTENEIRSLELEEWLEAKVPVAIANAITIGDLDKALEWWKSKYNRKHLLGLGAYKRLLQILLKRLVC